MSSSSSLNLKDQTSAVADHRLARIREKFDAMALSHTFVLPLIYLQGPLYQIAFNAKPAMMGQAWRAADQETQRREQRIVSELRLVSVMHRLQPGIA